jgi:hypothetical protein
MTNTVAYNNVFHITDAKFYGTGARGVYYEVFIALTYITVL